MLIYSVLVQMYAKVSPTCCCEDLVLAFGSDTVSKHLNFKQYFNSMCKQCLRNILKNLNQLFESQDCVQKEVHGQQLLVFNLSIKGKVEKKSNGIRRVMKRGKDEGKWVEKSTKLC